MEIDDDILELIINARIMNFKNNKNIKKYLKTRSLHTKVLSNMIDYLEYENFDLCLFLNEMMNKIEKEIEENNLKFNLELLFSNEKDLDFIYNLVIYNDQLKVKLITKKYIKQKQNLKMIKSMNKSYLGLFKLVEVNREEAYIKLEEIYSHKTFNIITLSLSLVEQTNIYIFTRIIEYNQICFFTGPTLTFSSNNKLLRQYKKIYQNVHLSDATKYLIIYYLYQNDNNKLNINTNYI